MNPTEAGTPSHTSTKADLIFKPVFCKVCIAKSSFCACIGVSQKKCCTGLCFKPLITTSTYAG